MIPNSLTEKKCKILISVSLAFFFVFSGFFIVYYNYFNPVIINNFDSIVPENPFFIQNQNIDQKKIFIFGASAVRSINSEIINEKLTITKPEFVMYNTGYNMDTPNLRIKIIDEIIELDPKIVFYGISFKDFTNSTKDPQLFDIKESLVSFEVEQFPYLVSINPKFSTLNYIRTLFGTSEVFHANIITSDYAPFFEISTLQMRINENISVDEIEHIHISYEDNEQFFHLKQIINELQKNNIKVVIFMIPLHHSVLDLLTDEDKKNIDLILENISKEYNTPIYDFTTKYSHLPIWTDEYHVAYNENSLIFTNDVLEMMLKESP